MKAKILWALVVLNVVLAAGLVARVTKPNEAMAQARRPADYQLITGQVVGASSEVVYIVDSSNGLLGAMTYDDTAHRLQTMAPINLMAVFDRAAGAGAGRRPR